MHISRIEVEGGFLSGLDVSLSPGFNAIIGARGCGKTSIIELVRFCLDAPVLSDRIATEVKRHALAVLGEGRVTVTISDGEQHIAISRSNEDPPDKRAVLLHALVLAQNEIEALGLNADSRLRLLDGFGARPRPEVTSDVASIEAEIGALRSEVHRLDEELAALAPLIEQLAQGRKDLAQFTAQSKQIEAATSSLGEINAKLQPLLRDVQYWKQSRASLAQWLADLTKHLARLPIPSEASELQPQYKPILDRLKQWKAATAPLISDASKIVALLDGNIAADQAKAQGLEAQSRPLRARIEELNSLAGEAARRVGSLERRVSEGEAIAKLREQRGSELAALRVERTKKLAQLDLGRSDRSKVRKLVAQGLNAKLKPKIRLEVSEAANTSDYARRIIQALRGSGLHTADVAARIAERISPADLVGMVDREDKEQLAQSLSISLDRARRLISALLPATSTILASVVEDDVSLSLLDGSTFKSTDELSTGQRCTVILPILLSTESGALIIDQPEDHLDNAFVVDTLVKAIRQRPNTLQLIWTTHNANLPVLGEADNVVQMDSNGLRGFKKVHGALDDGQVVQAITNVMEGGVEAFEKRARFYKAHLTR